MSRAQVIKGKGNLNECRSIVCHYLINRGKILYSKSVKNKMAIVVFGCIEMPLRAKVTTDTFHTVISTGGGGRIGCRL